MPLSRASLALLLLTACQDELRHVPFPPGEGTVALLVEEARATRLWILPAGHHELLRLEPEDPGSTILAAVVFEAQDPAELRLPSDAVELEPAGPLTRTLPLEGTGLRFFQEREGIWQESSSPHPRFLELHFRDPSLCPSVGPHDV